MKNEISKLLSKPMDRKAFLQYMGVAALAVTGITGLMSALMNAGGDRAHRSNGYGSSRYGR